MSIKNCVINNNFYVYLHRRNNDNSIFYVGKGKNKRAYSTSSRNIYWKNTVNKYGYYVEIVHSSLNETAAFELEEFLISEFKIFGIKLVNMSNGGEGNSGHIPSKESREKMSNSHKGKKLSEAAKEKVSKFNKGKIHSEETKIKISISHKGKQVSEATKSKLSKINMGSGSAVAKPANIYNYLTDELIATNIIIGEWCRFNTNYKRSPLYKTTKANRSLPSSRTNAHHYKGIYALYI